MNCLIVQSDLSAMRIYADCHADDNQLQNILLLFETDCEKTTPGRRVRSRTYAMVTQETTLQTLTERLIEFRDARDWRQFHSLKDLILSLNLEATELLELAQWKPDDRFETEAGTPELRDKIAEESADVLLYLLLIAERANIDLLTAASRKIDRNEEKYPVDKAHGNARKYTDL